MVGRTVKKQIEQAYLEATGRWQGCSWHTQFGSKNLDLCDMSSSQAQLMARATSGEEAEAWREASKWLRQLERDARRAENAATRATKLCEEGKFRAAARSAKRAYELESNYRTSEVWSDFFHLIEKSVAAVESTDT